MLLGHLGQRADMGKQLLLRGFAKLKIPKKRDIYHNGSGWKFGKSLQNSPKLITDRANFMFPTVAVSRQR